MKRGFIYYYIKCCNHFSRHLTNCYDILKWLLLYVFHYVHDIKKKFNFIKFTNSIYIQDSWKACARAGYMTQIREKININNYVPVPLIYSEAQTGAWITLVINYSACIQSLVTHCHWSIYSGMLGTRMIWIHCGHWALVTRNLTCKPIRD